MKVLLQKWSLLLFAMLLLNGCERQPAVYQLGGATMGTTWSVTALEPVDAAPDGTSLQKGVEAILESVNASMSTYLDDSEISRLNRSATNQWFGLSSEFYQVLSAALAVGRESGGAYDITVGPLVNLWGFGPGGSELEPPAPEAIADVLGRVGQDKLRIDGERYAVLKQADVSLDLSSIAKGFAVDRIAQWLAEQGIADYLVEVGGEMRVAGSSPRGDAWRVAIERPDAERFAIAEALQLSDAAIATSGDYRNFFEFDGKRYSHSIDPRTGYPVAHELVSVTVVHASAMLADAWATALLVMGADAAMSVARERGLAVYLIARDGDSFLSRHSADFAPLLDSPPEP